MVCVRLHQGHVLAPTTRVRVWTHNFHLVLFKNCNTLACGFMCGRPAHLEIRGVRFDSGVLATRGP